MAKEDFVGMSCQLNYTITDTCMYSESLGSWTLYIVLNSKQLETTMIRNLDQFPSSGEGREIASLWGPIVHKPSDSECYAPSLQPSDSARMYCYFSGLSLQNVLNVTCNGCNTTQLF
jgi:hypothetical protein